MVRKSCASALLVVVLSGSSAFASENARAGARVQARERDRDQPSVIVKVIRLVKDIRGLVSNSHLAGDPIP